MAMIPITDVADWRLSDDDFLESFKLPQKGKGVLAERYPFPKEDRITFDEQKHEYTIDGVIAPRSVTNSCMNMQRSSTQTGLYRQ